MWVFHNFFQPVMRLEEKIMVATPDKPHHVIRHFDLARTPFDRLLETDVLDEKTRECTRSIHMRLFRGYLRVVFINILGRGKIVQCLMGSDLVVHPFPFI